MRPDPKNHMKSWVIKWKGNKPVLEQTTWAPGYTPGHRETPQEAIAQEAIDLMDQIAAFREKWLHLNLLAEQQNHQLKADAFGSILDIQVTETDDPHEKMTMPEGAQSVGEVHQAQVSIPLVDPGDIDVVEGADIVEHMYPDGDVPSGLKDGEVYGYR